MYSKFNFFFNLNFSKIYPAHSTSLYDLAGMILPSYIDRCHIYFLQNISRIGPVVLEKKSFEWFLPFYMGMVAILNFGAKPFAQFFIIQPIEPTYEIWLHLAQ